MNYLLLLLLTSCAVNSYKLQKEKMTPYEVEITRIEQKVTPLEISEVMDKRGKQDLGTAYTGVQYSATPIELDVPLTLFVKDYMNESLQKRNIPVVTQSDIKLAIQIEEFSIGELIEKMKPERAKCQIQFRVLMERPKGTFSGNYRVEYISAGNTAENGTKKLEPTLATCLNDITEKLIQDPKFQNFVTQRM
jgi:uncharacterized lipoprotein YajG